MRTFLLAATILLIGTTSHAQAWLPQKGEGTISLDTQSIFVKDHLSSTGRKDDLGHIRANVLRAGGAYGITDRLMVTGDIAYVQSKYEGFKPHGLQDRDRLYHGDLQDGRLGVLYAVSTGRIAATTMITAVAPLTNYSARGHSAIGRHLMELSAGSYAGTRLGDDAYVQLGYAYTIVEHIEGVATNRSNADLELGYFVTPALSVRGIASWQRTYGGFDLPRDFAHQPGEEIHDRVGKARYIHLGGGATYALNRSTAIYVVLMKTYYGRNTHAARGISSGISWTFTR